MMRIWMLLGVISLVMSAGCSAAAPQAPSVDYQATTVVLSVASTVLAGENAMLATQMQALAQRPTATPYPTYTPVPAYTAEAPCPTQVPTPDPTVTPTARPMGSISGSLGYPSEYNPAQRVVAFNVATGEYAWVNTVDGQNTYKISDLPEGTYHVMAYLIVNASDDFIAGYSVAAVCMAAGSSPCDDHTLVGALVKGGQETTNINPIDWYATDPAGLGWRLDPTIRR